ncbi:MAG TPA: putrescine ABC transporter permease PotH [Alphaproteobacteria bacterium]|jgi:putrescine transport system permease protein|nr:putrescine ABC transporter permease PotH [Alphaproteobacteria bacterium]
MNAAKERRRDLLALPWFWLVLFVLAPLLIVLAISISSATYGAPPLEMFVHWKDGHPVFDINFDNYALLGSDSLYLRGFLNSIGIAFETTVLCLAVGYPMAYVMARAPERIQPLLVMGIVLPFWTSSLIRVYAWIGILKENGLLNGFLIKLGLIHEPLVILNTPVAVQIGMVYSYLPFLVLPLFATLQKLDWTLLEAAADLGAKPWSAFFRVTLPLSWSGTMAGALLVFVPASGEYLIPELLGSAKLPMISTVLWTEFFANRDWPVASAIAVVLLLILAIPLFLVQGRQGAEGRI